MSERLEAARFMRESATQLRHIAASETVKTLSPELLRIADQVEEEAARLEQAFRLKPPTPANDEDAA
jgi:hypothetical protein